MEQVEAVKTPTEQEILAQYIIRSQQIVRDTQDLLDKVYTKLAYSEEPDMNIMQALKEVRTNLVSISSKMKSGRGATLSPLLKDMVFMYNLLERPTLVKLYAMFPELSTSEIDNAYNDFYCRCDIADLLADMMREAENIHIEEMNGRPTPYKDLNSDMIKTRIMWFIEDCSAKVQADFKDYCYDMAV